MQNTGLPTDAIVEDDVEGYPTDKFFHTEELQSEGVSPLLRIERGRVKNPEVFGNLSLSQGFFKIANNPMVISTERSIQTPTRLSGPTPFFCK